MINSTQEKRVIVRFASAKALMFAGGICTCFLAVFVYILWSIFFEWNTLSFIGKYWAFVFILIAPIGMRDYLAIGYSVVKNGNAAIYVSGGRVVYLEPRFFSCALADVAPVTLSTGMQVNVITLDDQRGKRRHVPLNLLIEGRDQVVSALNDCLPPAPRA